MDDDGDVVEVDVIEQGGLEQLQPLVHQGCGVDGDDPPHVPGGVLEGIGSCDVGQLGTSTPTERSARGSEDETTHLAAPSATQALGEGRVLGVDGHDLAAAVRSNVINSMEQMTSLEVTEVNITITDIHVPSDDQDDDDNNEPRVA